MALPLDPASAQQYFGSGRYGRSVIVNPEVLNSLGGGPMVQPQPFRPGSAAYYNPTVPYSPFGTTPQGSFPLARPGNLLFPPVQRPTSQVLAPTQLPQYASPAVPAYPPQPQAALLPQPGAAVSQEAQSQLLVPAPQAAPSPQPSVPEQPAAPAAAIAAVPALPSVPAQPAVPQAPTETVAPSAVATPQAAAVAPEAAPMVPVVTATPAVVEEEPEIAAEPAAPVEPAEAELPPPPEPEAEEAPEPAVAATPEPAPQAAAAAPAPATEPAARVLFDAGSADLSADGKSELESLAQRLSADDSLRVQLLAFAAGDDKSANAARRLSLSRALVVRGFLIDQGIPSTRMQVRALGNKFESGPPDRVDIRPQSS